MSGKKRSVIWNYFTASAESENALCDTCKTNIKTPTGNTSKMTKHLSLHASVYSKYLEDAKKAKEESSAAKRRKVMGTANTGDVKGSSSTQQSIEESINKLILLSNTDPKAQSITKSIAVMMAVDFQPFSLVNDRGFRGVLRAAEPRYKIPDRTTFSRTVVPRLFEKTTERVKEELKEDMSFGVAALTFTTDTWTSKGMDSYISLTSHYLRKDFTAAYYVLANSPFPTAHTADNILEKLETLMSEWNIPSTGFPVYVVSDNARNFRAALSRSKWIPVQCFAHTLQLAILDAKKATSGVENLITSGKAIVGHFNRSTTARKHLQKLQVQMGKPEHELIQNVDTRWNSEHDMLVRLLEQKETISSYLLSAHTSVDNLTTNEWKLAAGVV